MKISFLNHASVLIELDQVKLLTDHFMPFASYHYYRAPESIHQNGSLLDGQELATLSKKMIPAHIGDEITITHDGNLMKHML